MTNAFDANWPRSLNHHYTVKQLPYGTLPQQFGHLYLPIHETSTPVAPPRPTILLIHGGFWRAAYDLTLMNPLAQDLVQRGLAVWNIEYRRVGEDGGGYPGTLQDVAAAADYLTTIAQDYAIDTQQVISIGHSAGGHLAFWLAARPNLPPQNELALLAPTFRFKGTISQAGVVDLELAWHLNLGNGAVAQFMGGAPNSQRARYELASPAHLVPLSAPQLLIHGTEDTRVTLEVSQTFVRKARAAGTPPGTVTLIELAGVNHMDLIDPTTRAWQKTLEWIQKQLA